MLSQVPLLLDLSGWAALAQIVQCAFVVVALALAIWQIMEANKARRLQATTELIKEIGGDTLRKARFWVLNEMPALLTDLNNLSREEFLQYSHLSLDDYCKARDVAIAYDRVAYMTKQRLLPDKALFSFQRDEIEQLWEKLSPIVKHIRESRPHYCDHLLWLATEWLGDQKEKEKQGMII